MVSPPCSPSFHAACKLSVSLVSLVTIHFPQTFCVGQWYFRNPHHASSVCRFTGHRPSSSCRPPPTVMHVRSPLSSKLTCTIATAMQLESSSHILMNTYLLLDCSTASQLYVVEQVAHSHPLYDYNAMRCDCDCSHRVMVGQGCEHLRHIDALHATILTLNRHCIESHTYEHMVPT
jgi:hypothetical protein